jgi:hypothetical protein
MDDVGGLYPALNTHESSTFSGLAARGSEFAGRRRSILDAERLQLAGVGAF